MQQNFPHPNKPATLYDLQMFVSNIETLFEQINRLIEVHFIELSNLINQQEHVAAHPTIPSGMNSKSPIVLSAIPAANQGAQLPTLLYTPETKQVFLRTALCRDLFQRLKRVSKRWLANVSEDQRRQATKVAQSIAKAVIDLRVSNITQTDLENYRARIRQALGRPYHIPPEQLRLALSQKIRVYLQNTKNKHTKWVSRFGGKLDINQTRIIISGKDGEDSSDDIHSPKENDISLLSQMEPSLDPPAIVPEKPNLTKRPQLANLEQVAPKRHNNAETNILYESLSEDVYQIAYSKASSLSMEQYNELSTATLEPGKDPVEQEEYLFNVATLSLWINMYPDRLTRRWNTPQYLQSCFGIFTDYCADKRVFSLSLEDMEHLLIRTCFRMLASCLTAGKPITMTSECISKDRSINQAELLNWIAHQYLSSDFVVEESLVMSCFYDFGCSFDFPLVFLPSSDRPSIMDYLCARLHLSMFPAENHYSKIHLVILMLIFCRPNVDLSSTDIPELAGFRALSSTVLDDMLERTPILHDFVSVEDQPAVLNQWKFFSNNW